jgi:hypothetical protein
MSHNLWASLRALTLLFTIYGSACSSGKDPEESDLSVAGTGNSAATSGGASTSAGAMGNLPAPTATLPNDSGAGGDTPSNTGGVAQGGASSPSGTSSGGALGGASSASGTASGAGGSSSGGAPGGGPSSVGGSSADASGAGSGGTLSGGGSSFDAGGSGGMGGSAGPAPVFGEAFLQVADVLQTRCGSMCHSGLEGQEHLINLSNDDLSRLHLQLTTPLETNLCYGENLVSPGSPEASILLQVLQGPLDTPCVLIQMPAGCGEQDPCLQPEDLAIIESWIAAGARAD